MLYLVQTCGACPEQYDVFSDKECTDNVGYLRLRHGYFCAEHRGQIVYEADTRGDGSFEYEERDFHLSKAVRAIETAMNGVSDNYEIVYEIPDPDDF